MNVANGPRISPASSIAVASAKPVSRDPRLKSSPTDVPSHESTTTQVNATAAPQPAQLSPKSAVVAAPLAAVWPIKENEIKTNSNTSVSSNKTNTTNKDASLHRSSQKKDSRLSSTPSVESPKSVSQNQSQIASASLGTNSSKSSSLSKQSSPSKSRDKSRRKSDKDKESAAKVAATHDANDEYDPGAPLPEVAESSSSSPSPPSKARKSKKTRASKRSPSPAAPYRIPKRVSKQSSVAGVTEEEQSGSLIVSPPLLAFKDIRPSSKQRNYVRRNKDGSASPQGGATDAMLIDASNKDEDLRANLVIPNTCLEKSKF